MVARRGVQFFLVVLLMEIAMHVYESIEEAVPHIKHLDMEI